MDRFFPVKKAVETVTAPDLVAAILFFRCADIFSGKRRETAYNLAQKSAAFLQKRVLASQQRLLCRAAKRGSADHCRILPYELHAIRHIVQPNLYAVMPRNTNLLQHAYLQAWKRNLLPEKAVRPVEQANALSQASQSSSSSRSTTYRELLGIFFWITCHAMNLGMHEVSSSV